MILYFIHYLFIFVNACFKWGINIETCGKDCNQLRNKVNGSNAMTLSET